MASKKRKNTEEKICERCAWNLPIADFKIKFGYDDVCVHCRRIMEELGEEKTVKPSKQHQELLFFLARQEKNRADYKIMDNLRQRAIVLIGQKIDTKTIYDLLGCTIDELREHIKEKFSEGMSWANYGEWFLGYVVPPSGIDLTKPKNQKTFFHYHNYLPLWKEKILKNKTNE